MAMPLPTHQLADMARATAIHAYELFPEVKDVRFPRTPGTQIFRVVARID